MADLTEIRAAIRTQRRLRKLSQADLARKAQISRTTLNALENQRLGEISFQKLTNLLSVLGLGLRLEAAAAERPTLDQLLEEDRLDQGVDRRK
jgi:transcriptional regulator with XRE-family HTH domain